MVAGVQGAGQVVGGTVGNTIQNTGVQMVNAADQIQTGNVVQTVGTLGNGVGTVMTAANNPAG